MTARQWKLVALAVGLAYLLLGLLVMWMAGGSPVRGLWLPIKLRG